MLLQYKDLLFGSRNREDQGAPYRFLAGSTLLIVSSFLFLTACGLSAPAAPPAPAVRVSTNNLDFGSWRIQTTSTAQTLTITNSGTATLTISGIALGGANAGAFSLMNNCGSSLGPGSNCTASVTFSPAGTTSVSASLMITDNASNSPQTVGLSGLGSSVSGVAHGMFMLDPPVNDNQCFAPFPPKCYSQHLVPTVICTGSGLPSGYGCNQAGAGEPYIKGAVFQVAWSEISPNNGTYDFSGSDSRMQAWTDSGKLVSFVFEPTSFGGTNNATPSWYLNPVPISSVSQTNGIIKVQSAAGFGFLPGALGSAAGLEIQIAGTGTALGTSTNPGVWVICDDTTPGCQNPALQVIYAIGPGGNTTAVSQGTVGNPVYGSADGSVCTSGILPIEWRPNFVKAWQALIAQAVAHYGNNTSVAYMRFGMGIGGQTEPTNGLSSFDTNPNPTACQAQMTEFGFTSVAAPWPDPGTPGWSNVSATWVSYLDNMLQYEQSLGTSKAIILTLSPIIYSPEDLTTIDTAAAKAAASGIGMGNQGLEKNDPINFSEGKPCYGGDWCANFPKYISEVPTEQQTLSDSDPTNQSQMGSLAPSLLTFATSHGTEILEIYFDDWMCTYDSAWNGNNHNTYSACTGAGYPAVFAAAAAQIN